jgi:DNA-binding IclR family transcriptional regulator
VARSDGSTERVVAVIDSVVRSGEVGVRELAAELGISRSAVHRIAQTLAELRVLRVLPTGRYESGALLVAWASFLAQRSPVLVAGRDVLAELATETRETVCLLGYGAGAEHAVVLDVLPAPDPVRYEIPVGSLPPLHAGAAGKAILAFLDDDRLRSLDRPRLTEATPRSLAALRRDLARVRHDGFATSVGERIAEAAGAAAPYFRGGVVCGSVNVTLPRYRLANRELGELGARARRAADDLTAALASAAAASASAPPLLAADRRPPMDAPSARRGQGSDGRDVARVVAAIDALARSPRGGVGAVELAGRLPSAASTAEALLRRLAGVRMAASWSGDRYEADARLLAWPGVLPPSSLDRLAGDLMADLGREAGETVYLIAYDAAARRATFAAVHECDKPIRHVVELGSDAPLGAGAAGKAILGSLDPGARPGAAGRGAAARLERDLGEIRRRGFATSVGEHMPDAAGVAAPFLRDGAVAGSLTVSIPRYRFSAEAAARLGPRVAAAARELTSLLTATDPERQAGATRVTREFAREAAP